MRNASNNEGAIYFKYIYHEIINVYNFKHLQILQFIEN